jgi:hypothetical protein
VALNDASKAPKSKRKRQWNKDIVDEIRYFRQPDPNLGKDKLYPLIKDVCNKHNMVDSSVSSMGRMINDDQDKMRVFPLKINHVGLSEN